ncbi:hypothetical protein Nepgr_022959 [Nepenthes gracilis]|uniref:Uncharacterized protein n=1 Tax=Nepenthes gracilis TaxID=150966 RepID=A0AAD3XXA3_NEPGR|nr:hypothetical protein Nepgr_022959 [Nepenthes gracilis]
MLVVLLVIADPARMSLGSWWLIRYVNLLTAAEMVQCHILAAVIVLDDLVTGILVNGLFRWLMALPAGMHSNAKFGMPGTEEWLDPEVVCCVAIGSAYGPMANWQLQLLIVIGLVVVGVWLAFICLIMLLLFGVGLDLLPKSGG